MTAAQADPPILAPVPSTECRQALALVFSYLSPKERDEQIDAILATPLRDGNAVPGLLGAYRQNRLVGAVFAQLQLGRVAQVWLPRLVSGEPPETAAKLLGASNAWLKEQHVELAQMLF